MAGDMEYLAQRQSHWMEQLVLPALATIFVAATVMVMREFLQIFLPALGIPPWVVLAAAAAALEGVWLTPILIKARTPVTTRVLELAVILAGTYLLLYLGSKGALPPSPLAVWRESKVYVPVLLVTFGWLEGCSLGGQFFTLGTLRDIQSDYSQGNLSWEQEAMFSQYRADLGRVSVVGQMTRKVLGWLACFALAGAIAIEVAASRGFPLEWKPSLVLSAALLVASGLALQGCVYLYRLQTIWRESRVQVDGALPGRWLSGLLVTATGVVGFCLLVPGPWPILPFTAVMQWLGRLLAPITRLEGTWSNPAEVAAPPAGQSPSPWLAEDVEAPLLESLLFLLLILLVLGTILAMVGAVVVMFIGEEIARVPGLLRLPLLIFLHLRRCYALLLRWGRRTLKGLVPRPSGLKDRSRTAAEPIKGEFSWDQGPPSTLSLYLRYVFVALAKRAKSYGAARARHQTAQEYGSRLKQVFSQYQDAVAIIVQAYQEARYGYYLPQAGVRDRVEAAWTEIQGSEGERDSSHTN